ncbi:MAG: hypothetical protein ABSH05_23150 [Bryobacteraceae bacterium]|jgi:hypothetical protein
MLVWQAAALAEARRIQFGNPQDIEAAQLLGLYAECVRAVSKRLRVDIHVQKKLVELWHADRATLEAYLHPGIAKREEVPCGD